MSSSDDDFDDDNDDVLLQDFLLGKTQIPENPTILQTQNPIPVKIPQIQQANTQAKKETILDDEVQAKLFQADGEIATLRAQLQQLQRQKQEEVSALKESFNTFKESSENQLSILKNAVQTLEDEKKFLNNELISKTAIKKRKTESLNKTTTSTSANEAKYLQQKSLKESVTEKTGTADSLISAQDGSQGKPIQKVIRLLSDSSLLIDQLWNHSIVGSKRTSFEYLNKICIDFDLELNSGLKIVKRTSLSSSIVEFLMMNKNNRLDKLIEIFTISTIQLVERLLQKKYILAIPFILSLIDCALSFRPAALTKSLIVLLLKRVSKITESLLFLLNSNLDEDDLVNYHDVPYQVMVLEKFIFLECLDLIERLVTLTTTFDIEFIKTVWHNPILPQNIITSCLPDNSERFRNTAQINVVFNIVELLVASVTEETFAYNDTNLDEKLILSLLKVFLIDIPVREEFMFYGLNRILGNNCDFLKIDSVIPKDHDHLNNYLIVIPQPIPFDIETPQQFRINMNHEYHLLILRLKIAELFLSLIITKQTFDFLYNKEHFKSLIRVIGFEQNHIAQSPRSKHVYLRLQLISMLVKIIDYLTQDLRDASELIYSELMYEIFVVFLRIAFGADSLSIDAHKLLVKIRNRPGGKSLPVFNKWCETRARQLNHVSLLDFKVEVVANVESDFANGLEFPYESETVELARNILNRFVDHDEAENLYVNMNAEDPHDSDDEGEMDLT